MYPTKINIDTDGPWGRIGAAGAVMEQSDERRNVLIDALESDVRMDGRVVAMFAADDTDRLPRGGRFSDSDIRMATGGPRHDMTDAERDEAGDIRQLLRCAATHDPRRLPAPMLHRLHALSARHAEGLPLEDRGDLQTLLSGCRIAPTVEARRACIAKELKLADFKPGDDAESMTQDDEFAADLF